ncbi:MAG: GTPase ObgE [Vicinamibacterales bacterium]
MFVDDVEIVVESGAGGPGCLSFRREKFVPRGGPDGGNGGAGGSVVLVADPHRNTLLHFRYNPEHRADRGRPGEGALRTGKAGRDLEVPVPPGTTVSVADPDVDGQWVPLADLTRTGQKVVVARGGRGGLGNAMFVSATNRAPRKVQPGEPGEKKRLRLTLKLLADVGLVGFPNAGKSTLIARASAARPKIADYPFTTLTPNLGVVSLSGERTFVIADVPGLIEGAHTGHGLGHQFLRHVERTAVLVHVVDVSGASGRDPVTDLDVVRRELDLFDAAMLEKPQLVVANKIDALDEPARLDALRERAQALNLPFLAISAAAGTGVGALLEAVWPHVAAARAEEAARAAGDDDAPLEDPAGP